MNKEQFIYWLKGYAAGHEHAPTPKQWGTIVSELDKIQDCPDFGSPIDDNKLVIKPDQIGGGWITTSTAMFDRNNLPKGTNISYTSNQLELDLK
jgi:hypothetical protein